MSFNKSFSVALAFCLVLASFGCTAKPEVIRGAAYVKYPKADVLGQVKGGTRSYALLICDPDSKVRLLSVYDSTILGNDSVQLRSETEVNSAVVCGFKLEELNRLAEIGRKYDKK